MTNYENVVFSGEKRMPIMPNIEKIDFELSFSNSKKVSFVIPVYKTEHTLEKSIKSLLDQDYENIEIVIVADGKSPGAEKIINKIQDRRIIKYLTIPHGGAPRSRNEGYKYTKGDYVSFWDSDCYAEPGMVRVWVKAFTLHPDVSFVYSGYRFNDTNYSFLNSEPFNKYLLTCNNYIATMFPMKRDLFPGFDETLKSLQDWDLWLTLTEQGYTGFYLEGSGFTTEMSNSKSISGIGCTRENWLDRYETVRKKHNIINRDVCFTGIESKYRAIELAELMGGDYMDDPSFHPHRYKMIYAVGMFAGSMQQTVNGFRYTPEGCKRVIHWLGVDIESIQRLPWIGVKALVKTINETIHANFSENESVCQLLNEVGIKSKLVSLPMEVKELDKPKQFKLFYEGDESTLPLLFSIEKAMPDIKMESPERCELKDYSCFISITNSKCPSENLKRFIAAGKPVITNYQLPYAGYLSDEGNVGKYKSKLIEKIRWYAKHWKNGNGIKPEATEYYRNLLNPTILKTQISEVLEGKVNVS